MTAVDYVESAAPKPPLPLRFDLREFSGSLGDMGTFLPLVVAMCIECRIDFGIALVCAGILNIATGLIFRQPLPVQPMKALAAVAIAEKLGYGSVVAAGIAMSVVLLLVASTPALQWLIDHTSKALVRGIQLCIGLTLAVKGVRMLFPLPLTGWDGWVTTTVLSIGLIALLYLRQPALLCLFLAGFVLIYLKSPDAFHGLRFSLPPLHLIVPARDEWLPGILRGAAPQIPLTLLNSVVAVCALSGEYFPGRGIAPRRMAISVGVMNLLTVPFGGVPMCHGAGGLAAQYKFGARSGGSVIMLGAMKVVVGVLFGSAMLGLLARYPHSVLGIMLIAAGIALGSTARDTRGFWNVIIVLLTAGLGVAFNVAIGFAGGAIIAVLHASGGRPSRPVQS